MLGYVKKAKVIALLDKEIEALKAKYRSSVEELIQYAKDGLGQSPEYKFEEKQCHEYTARLAEAYKLRKLIEKEVV